LICSYKKKYNPIETGIDDVIIAEIFHENNMNNDLLKICIKHIFFDIFESKNEKKNYYPDYFWKIGLNNDLIEEILSSQEYTQDNQLTIDFKKRLIQKFINLYNEKKQAKKIKKQEKAESFNNLLNENSNFKYLGMLNLQEDIETSLNILGSYDIFLFPSFWESEGHPGALIDAMTSGLAIVATDWNSNAEFTNGNGLLIPIKDAEALKNAVDFYIENPTELEKHQIKSSERAKEYHSSNICPKYLNSLS
jgi:hypothetical protein